MTKKWDEAAAAYHAQPVVQPPGFEMAVRQLKEFIEGEEGRSAMRLLSASKRYVVLFADLAGDVGAESWVLTHEGLGYWIGISAGYGYTDANLNAVSPREVVNAAVTLKQPLAELVNNLRRELNKIAEQAPKKKS